MSVAISVVICENRAGLKPSERTVRMLRRKCRRKGLLADWDTVMTLDTGALLLGKSTEPCGANLVAVEVGRGWRRHWEFMTEREYLEL